MPGDKNQRLACPKSVQGHPEQAARRDRHILTFPSAHPPRSLQSLLRDFLAQRLDLCFCVLQLTLGFSSTSRAELSSGFLEYRNTVWLCALCQCVCVLSPISSSLHILQSEKQSKKHPGFASSPSLGSRCHTRVTGVVSCANQGLPNS